MKNCGCGPDEACDVCDHDLVDQAVAAGAEPVMVPVEEADDDPQFSHQFGQEAWWTEDADGNTNLNDPAYDRLAEERASMLDAMRDSVAEERGVDVDDLDGYFDAENNWVDLISPRRKGTYGKPHLDFRDFEDGQGPTRRRRLD